MLFDSSFIPGIYGIPSSYCN